MSTQGPVWQVDLGPEVAALTVALRASLDTLPPVQHIPRLSLKFESHPCQTAVPIFAGTGRVAVSKSIMCEILDNRVGFQWPVRGLSSDVMTPSVGSVAVGAQLTFSR